MTKVRMRGLQTWPDTFTFTLRTVYLTCIRPHLEYAAQLWDPCNKKDIEPLGSVPNLLQNLSKEMGHELR